MLPVLQIGPLALQTSGLILLLGLWASLSLTEWFASRHQTQASGLNPNKLYNLALGVLAAGLVGARLSYVIRYPPAFIQSPLSIFSLNPGLLDPWGGFVAALVTGLIYGNRKGLSFWPTLDAFTPAFAVLALAVSLSHVASGQAFGVPADLPWAIELWGARRHPSQVYETIAAVLILWAIWPGRIRDPPRQPAGGS